MVAELPMICAVIIGISSYARKYRQPKCRTYGKTPEGRVTTRIARGTPRADLPTVARV
jgi:hypothetical protein